MTFVGTSPNSSVEISGGNDSVTYSPDIKSGMKNGDVVTITAETDYSNISLKENKKQYTVDGLSAYAMKLEEIPDDMKEKMQKQANDAIKASTASWHQGVSLKQLDFVGYYFLTSKDGFNQTPYNQLYCVYKGTANVTGLKRDGDGKTQETGEETFIPIILILILCFLMTINAQLILAPDKWLPTHLRVITVTII